MFVTNCGPIAARLSRSQLHAIAINHQKPLTIFNHYASIEEGDVLVSSHRHKSLPSLSHFMYKWYHGIRVQFLSNGDYYYYYDHVDDDDDSTVTLDWNLEFVCRSFILSLFLSIYLLLRLEISSYVLKWLIAIIWAVSHFPSIQSWWWWWWLEKQKIVCFDDDYYDDDQSCSVLKLLLRFSKFIE